MKTLYTNLTDLTRDKRLSYLNEDVVQAATTIRIQSLVGFESLDTSSGQVLLLGKLGNEKSEVVRTSNTTGPGATYKEITLRDALLFDHPQDTPAYIIDFDRVETQWAASVNGTKATVAAYPFKITPDLPEMLYVDTSATAGFFFTRFNRSIDGQNSDWSDAIPYSGYDDNMVAAIKKRALDLVGEEIDGKVITHEYLNECLWQARREYHLAPGKRPFRRVFNKIIGTALTGSYRIELPTDLEKPNTAENVYGVRLGTNPDMTYYDKKEWDFDYISKPHSALTVPYTRGISTSLWLANGSDFSQSGVVSVEGMSIGYTKVTGSLNSLTITAHGSYPSASAGSDVWQNVSYGTPYKYTVWADPQGSAYIYFNMPIETAVINQNIYMDYYRTLVGYYSDAGTLDEPGYDMFVHYLAYKIKERKTRGGIPVGHTRSGQVYIADADFQTWNNMKNQLLSSEYDGSQIRIAPDISHLQLPDDSQSNWYLR